ncbi:hypothetical protein BJ986_000220 [Phycicoccus badiiscoriae]|uniref:DUF4192 domain-containing protein n=1 Tax=Pedococcus badiiscoriae TaxID=642776 RepID=A0A852W9M5_9MICO|nr:DUF4192 domain-containing protein [Pedococcus badiiscoriae]NYG05733.1 hypothetical protein [Pedococcus badiiscoriae]
MSQIRLRGPADVVAVLPYQLGYHPQDSIVVLALHGRSVGLIERIDLPPPEDVEQVGLVLVGPLLRDRPEAVMLVGYETERGASRPVLDVVRRLATEADLDVLDRLVVHDGRWFGIDCAEPCCPPDGVRVQAAVDTPAVAEYVGLEVSPLRGRSAIADLVAADRALAAQVSAELTAVRRPYPAPSQAVGRLQALAGWAVVCDVTGGALDIAELGPVEVSRLVRSVEDLELRDALVAWLCPGSLPLESLSADLLDAMRCILPAPTWHHRSGGGASVVAGRRLLARFMSLVRRVPDERAAPALTVLANLAWWQGDGALARTCLDRALRSSPEYRLALLLERMLDLGVRPGGRGQLPPAELLSG